MSPSLSFFSVSLISQSISARPQRRYPAGGTLSACCLPLVASLLLPHFRFGFFVAGALVPDLAGAAPSFVSFTALLAGLFWPARVTPIFSFGALLLRLAAPGFSAAAPADERVALFSSPAAAAVLDLALAFEADLPLPTEV